MERHQQAAEKFIASIMGAEWHVFRRAVNATKARTRVPTKAGPGATRRVLCPD
jgi:hypothetical protein